MPNWTSEQKDAIEKGGTNIIVSAGAGSGKTAVLTARVLRKLNEGININELLILTFTNAAAHEMRERIKEEIQKDEKLKEQLDLLDISYITTFDSYALSIVKKYHYLLNVSPNISICDSTLIKIEKEKILDKIFNNLYEEKNPLFLKLIDDLCTKDDKEIRNYILNIDDKLNLKIDKEEYIDNYEQVYNSDNKINENINLYVDLLKEKIKDIKDLLYELSILSDGGYYQKLEESLKPLLSSNDYETIKNNLEIKLPSLPKNSSEELKNKKSELSDLVKDLQNLCKFSNIDDIKDKICISFDYITIILYIIKSLDKKLKAFKMKNNLFEFTDVAKMSISVIQNNESVKREVKDSLNEIMVDEYQDTNDLQEYFISLISNNNVYMVGDIKQSIYRFRNANPNIFKNKYHNYSLNNGGIKIDLNKNFRSRKEVVNNINLLFNYLMDEKIGGANYKQDHQMIFGNESYEENKPNQNYDLNILYYDYDKSFKYSKEEIEFFSCLNDIKNKIDSNYQIFDKKLKTYRRANYSDFVILMDRATSFDLAKKIFEYHKVPLTIYKDENINNSYDQIVIKSIILLIVKELKKEYDDEYKYLFVSLARSFVFEYSDELIFNLIKNDNYKDDEIIIKVKTLLNSIENMTISQLLNKIITEFNLYEKFIKIGNINDSIARLEYLYNVAKSLEEIGYTIYEFGEYLKEISDKEYDIKISSNKDDNNSVKIMTIHKSKGLEFPICYFLGLDKKFNLRDITDKFIYSENFGIVAPYYQNGVGTNIYVDLLKHEYLLDEISEKIRLFYVALTRAKEKLIMILPNSDKKDKFNLNKRIKNRSFSDFIYSLDEYLCKYSSQLDLDKLNLSKEYNLIQKTNYSKNINIVDNKIYIKNLNLTNNELIQNKFSKEINELLTKDQEKSRKLGLKFHEVLEYIDFNNPNLNNIEDNFLRKKVEKFLQSSLLKDISSAMIYKESEFRYIDNNQEYHGIIDLLLEYDNHINIIDYKLKNIESENYKNQLNGYKIYIEKIKTKKVNLYLYSILDEKFYEIK